MKTKISRGAEWTLSIPLTLAIIDGLLMEVANNSFVIPLSYVEECVEFNKDYAAKHNSKSCIEVRGSMTPYSFIKRTLRRVKALDREHFYDDLYVRNLKIHHTQKDREEYNEYG